MPLVTGCVEPTPQRRVRQSVAPRLSPWAARPGPRTTTLLPQAPVQLIRTAALTMDRLWACTSLPLLLSCP